MFARIINAWFVLTGRAIACPVREQKSVCISAAQLVGLTHDEIHNILFGG